MATRRAIINSITTAFEGSYASVTNKFRTPQELLEMTATTKDATFPWFNITLGVHSAVLDLGGTLEIEKIVPVIVVAYDVAENEETADDLQLVLADLADSVVNTVTSQANATAFAAAGFGVTDIQLFPAEDEEHWALAVLTANISCISGD